MSVVLGWWNSLLVVRAVRGMAEFLARGAIKTFYSDDQSQTAKIAVHKRGRASEHVFPQLQKRHMLAHEAMGTIVAIINIAAWCTCEAQNLMVAVEVFLIW